MDLAQWSGRRNKHIDVRLELFDESRCGKYSSEGKDVDLMDHSKDSDHSYSINGERMKLVRANPKIVDGDTRNRFAMEAASSSSSDALDDLFQGDTSKANISMPRNAIHQEAQPASKNGENSAINLFHLPDADNGSGPTSTSQPFDVSHHSVKHGLLPMLNPPTQQMMGPTGGYDPNMVPSSVSAVSPMTPTDWSLVSNESLFSIYLGNSSFSKDAKFLMDDLGKPPELMMLKESSKPDELSLYSPTFQIPMMETNGRKNDKMIIEFRTTGRTGEETMTEQQTESEHQTEVKRKRSGVTWNYYNLSGRSVGSGSSGKSFAFPILTDEEKNGSSNAYIERYYSASPMKTSSSSNDTCCCCCSSSCCYYSSSPSCFYFSRCPSCSLFCKPLSCSRYC